MTSLILTFCIGALYGIVGRELAVRINCQFNYCISDFIAGSRLRSLLLFAAWFFVIPLAISRYEKKFGPLAP